MKFSAQEEYGIRCLIAIARKGDGGSMTIPELSESEALSQPHVGKLMSVLRRSGWVRSTRGQVGGYMLRYAPKDILIGEVLSDLGGRLYSAGFCDRHSGQRVACVHDRSCSIRGLWSRIQQAVDNVTMRITLQDVLEGKTEEVVNVQLTPRHHISLKS